MAFVAVFLTFVLMATSGYVFRCNWMCTDQTSVQEDYVEQRDRCRKDAQLQVDTSSAALDENTKKAQLVSAFSRCMAENGWAVPDSGKAATGAAPAAAATAVAVPAAAAPAAATTAAKAAEEKATLSRASECAFARQSADVSSIAAARAKACDLECEQYLKAAPEAPRPAACPANFKESLAKGVEKE
jgi:hypothetical protein